VVNTSEAISSISHCSNCHHCCCISSATADDVFDKSFPSGAPPNLGILFSRLSRNRLMVRQPALTVIDLMRQAGADPEEAAAARAESAEAAAAKAGEDDNSDEATAEALALLQPPPGLVVLSSSGGKGVPVRGTGKTATLMHCVHWARSQGWLVLHVPKASEVMFGGWWVEPSREVDGDFDQPQVNAQQAHRLTKWERILGLTRFFPFCIQLVFLITS